MHIYIWLEVLLLKFQGCNSFFSIFHSQESLHRQTDRQTDTVTKTICPPPTDPPSGGNIIVIISTIFAFLLYCHLVCKTAGHIRPHVGAPREAPEGGNILLIPLPVCLSVHLSIRLSFSASILVNGN